ncbi:MULTISPECIES: DUF5818 domain-containing protein [unclassified Sphingomonas]|uniref:DUF5818 domain-containing protein n=1 Tax=unclassified Sphingomonas TaxID=196159 RepID=UPI002861E9B3|nr:MULTISPECIES: DUF5818 domain-containing protein [unclassified Sphingomonas]MDR6115872.1 hypothetical protein [Sphingomonas sp. SORGH_AS_0789]MDR6150457.1 hypothetical protein [Sphingomonas sp. SORGH_AS_0742]
MTLREPEVGATVGPMMTSDDALSDTPTHSLTGRLVRRHGAFILQCDDGATFELRLSRVPVDHVGKSVTITGRLLGPDLLEAEGVRAA